MSSRRQPGRRPLRALPGWFFLVAALTSLVAAGALVGALVNVDPSGSQDTAAPAPSASATPSDTPEPTPTEDATSEPAPVETTPAVDRASILVDVLNGGQIGGVAAAGADKVRAAGWTTDAVTNWLGTPVSETTVFYPEGKQAEAEALASDVGITSTAPTLDGMAVDQLTLVIIAALP